MSETPEDVYRAAVEAPAAPEEVMQAAATAYHALGRGADGAAYAVTVGWALGYAAGREAAAQAVRALHVRAEDFKGRPYCQECASLCHSRSGLGCDDVDGAWPCPTIAALDGDR